MNKKQGRKVKQPGNMAPVHAKPIEGQWHQVVEIAEEGKEPQKVMEVTSEDGAARPVMVQAQLYDETGEQILLIATMNMDGVPPPVVNNIRKLLQAQYITPTLILPDCINLMRLKPITKKAAQAIQRDAQMMLAEKKQGQGEKPPTGTSGGN